MIERKDTDGIRVLKLAHGKVSAMDLELGEAFTREDGGRSRCANQGRDCHRLRFGFFCRRRSVSGRE